MTQKLLPDYLNLDYATVLSELKEQLKKDNTFKDLDYEGSNISVIMELFSYISELNIFYQNKIAKNLLNFNDADIYEVVHNLSQLAGIKPKGYVSGYADISLNLTSGYNSGDILHIPRYTEFLSNEGKTFITTIDNNFTVPATGAESSFDMEFIVKEGIHEELNYEGTDLIDYKILLPLKKYDYDDNLTNDAVSCKVFINNTLWSRVISFYDDLSEMNDDSNIYTLNFNKNKEYNIQFSSIRNVPSKIDEIKIHLIECHGLDGDTGQNQIKLSDSNFLQNLTQSTTIDNEFLTFTNNEKTLLAANYQNIQEIKFATQSNLNSQYRCITKSDYNNYLKTKSDIAKANVWGEKDINHQGNVQEYNKVHMSFIPVEWDNGTISTSASIWTPSGTTIEVDIQTPLSYTTSFSDDISLYLEPRKSLNIFELYEVPELVYFYFQIELKINGIYPLVNVVSHIKDKLLEFFSVENREFAEIIDFKELENFVIDIDRNPEFEYIRGIEWIIFRDEQLNKEVFEQNENFNFPQYTTEEYSSEINNNLRPIKLGFNQFPLLTIDGINITYAT